LINPQANKEKYIKKKKTLDKLDTYNISNQKTSTVLKINVKEPTNKQRKINVLLTVNTLKNKILIIPQVNDKNYIKKKRKVDKLKTHHYTLNKETSIVTQITDEKQLINEEKELNNL